MPLKPDGLDRGEHATHVHRHPKLGRHRTVINTALPLMHELVDDESVRQVELGRIWYADVRPLKPYLGVESKGQCVGITISDEDAMQVIEVKVRRGNKSRLIAEQLRQKWCP